MKKHVGALILLILPLCVLFFPVFVLNRTVLPLDQLNTMFLPYSAESRWAESPVHTSTNAHAPTRVQAYNHFLTDAWAQVYPYKVRERANLLRGEFASWNPSILGGHPHYASTSFTHFDPTNFVLVLFEMPTAYHVQLFVKLLIAGLAMYALLAALGVQPLVCALFGAAYMLNSLFITTLQHQWILGAMAWMPLCILFLKKTFDGITGGTTGENANGIADKLTQTKSVFLNYVFVRDAFCAALFLALAFLGGSIQTSALCALIVVVVCAGYGFWSGVADERGGDGSQSRTPRTLLVAGGVGFGVACAVGVLAFCLSAVMWFPSIELFLLNVNPRAGGKEFSLLNGIKALPLLVSFVIPELIGSVRGFDLAKIAGADMNDFNASVGFAAWLFGAFGAFALWCRRPDARPYILLMVLGLVLPLFTPVYKFLYHRCFLMYVLGVCVVGAMACEALVSLFSKPSEYENLQMRFRKWCELALRGTAALVAMLAMVTIVLVWKHDRIYALVKLFVEKRMESGQLVAGNREWMLGRIDTFLNHYLLISPTMWLPLVLVACVLALLALWRTERVRGAVLLVALCIVNSAQMLVFAFAWLPMTDTEQFPLFPQTQSVRFLQSDTARAAEIRVLPIWDEASQRVFQPNTLDMYGVQMIQGYESLFPPNASRLAPSFDETPTTQQLRLGGLAGVKYYATSRAMTLTHPMLHCVYESPVNKDEGESTSQGQPPAAKAAAGVRLYENRFWRGRAHISYTYNVVPSADEQLRRLYDTNEAWNGATVLLFEKPAEADIAGVSGDTSTTSAYNEVSITAAENNRVQIAVQTAKAGFLVLADTYYPGWTAFVNGEPRTILRANYAVRAVAVPAGKSVVEFRFEPTLFAVGVGVSCGALCVVVAVIVLSMVAARRTARKAD